jgi:hypothetical protein
MEGSLITPSRRLMFTGKRTRRPERVAATVLSASVRFFATTFAQQRILADLYCCGSVINVRNMWEDSMEGSHAALYYLE